MVNASHICAPSPLQTYPVSSPTSAYDAMQKFLNLINSDQLMQVLLHCDRHNQVLDKWLIAIVFEYFQRARLQVNMYSREKFFIALYLAIEFEEDEDRKVKDVLFDFILHHDTLWNNKKQFIKKKDKYWKKLDFQCMVTKQRLEQIIAIDPYHIVWQRERKAHLSGANRSFTCKLDPSSIYKYQWPGRRGPTRRPPPEVIDLTKDSPPPVPIPRQQRRRTSAAYRHLNSIVTLIKQDRDRRRPPYDIMKLKHAQQQRLNELHMLETLARHTTTLNTELAHLNMNTATTNCLNQIYTLAHHAAAYPGLPPSAYHHPVAPHHVMGGGEHGLHDIPGLILLPDHQRISLQPIFDLGMPNVPSPNLPMVVPVVPTRNDHWV